MREIQIIHVLAVENIVIPTIKKNLNFVSYEKNAQKIDKHKI